MSILSKKNLIAFGICLTLIATFYLSIKLAKQYFLGKFNFDSVRENKNLDWNGPKEGETIDLSNLKTKQDKPFPVLPKQSLILLSIVDSKCWMCRTSQDLITQVQLAAKSYQIHYGMVSFVSRANSEEYFDYAETLSNSDEIYLWQGEKDSLSPTLQKMVVPSHLLVNEQGVILRSFPGSSADKEIRSQLANQIITEILSEKVKLQ